MSDDKYLTVEEIRECFGSVFEPYCSLYSDKMSFCELSIVENMMLKLEAVFKDKLENK